MAERKVAWKDDDARSVSPTTRSAWYQNGRNKFVEHSQATGVEVEAVWSYIHKFATSEYQLGFLDAWGDWELGQIKVEGQFIVGPVDGKIYIYHDGNMTLVS